MAGTELAIGLVGAAGSDLPGLCDALKRALATVNYETHAIRLSHELHNLQPFAHLAAITDGEEKIKAHMNAGNELRQKTRSDVMALLGIAAILGTALADASIHFIASSDESGAGDDTR